MSKKNNNKNQIHKIGPIDKMSKEVVKNEKEDKQKKKNKKKRS